MLAPRSAVLRGCAGAIAARAAGGVAVVAASGRLFGRPALARRHRKACIAKRAVPFRRYKEQVGHRSDPGVMSGRYPQKSAVEFLKLLDNLESNAEYKGMDLDRLKIVNATVHKGVLIKRFIPRAMGRASPKNNVLTHVELVAQEV